jgi:DNA-binding MarR family transcriptional regulator
MAEAGAEDNPLDYRGLDDVIHGRVRLAVMAFLSGAGTADFGRVRDATGVTDGNLSANLRKLEDAGYVTVEKRFVGRRPQTLCSLSDTGREAWLAYLARLETMLAGVRTPQS